LKRYRRKRWGAASGTLTHFRQVFTRSLRNADPSVSHEIQEFIGGALEGILDLRACGQRLLGTMHVRRREHDEVIPMIGDIFLKAANEFRLVYPTCIGRFAAAEKKLNREMENNRDFGVFLEVCANIHGTRCRSLEIDFLSLFPQAMLPASGQHEQDRF